MNRLRVAAIAGAAMVATACASAVAPNAPSTGTAGACGVERWAVKTMTDPGAAPVSLARVNTTIAALDALPVPPFPRSRVKGIETTTYRVHATIVFGRREADQDYHLGLSDGQGDTMIAESPSPSCATGSVVYAQIQRVREALDHACPQIGQGQTVRPTIQATITGIGFADRPHGQTDVAPNAIELHPITDIALNGRC